MSWTGWSGSTRATSARAAPIKAWGAPEVRSRKWTRRPGAWRKWLVNHGFYIVVPRIQADVRDYTDNGAPGVLRAGRPEFHASADGVFSRERALRESLADSLSRSSNKRPFRSWMRRF